MSPEMIQGDKVDNFKLDIWSVGIIFFELLYNEHPWKRAGKNQAKLISQINE